MLLQTTTRQHNLLRGFLASVPRCSASNCGLKTSASLSTENVQSASLLETSGSEEHPQPNASEPLTHYRITLRRSAIGLPKNKKATLEALGIHRRMQTVYHPHAPEFAGKILALKELVEVENVSASQVRTKEEQTRDRRPSRGYVVVRRAGS
jgi:ribosomal protein L30